MHVHKSILFIEDDENIQRVYERALLKAGYKVHVAQEAQEAIDILDTFEKVHCVVSDLFLPEHNGLSVLHHLQSYQDWQDIPVILLTSQPEKRFQATDEYKKDLGIVAYCDKSNTAPQDLVQIVDRITGGNST